MKKLLLLVGLLSACGSSSGQSSNEFWETSVRHTPDMAALCTNTSSVTFKLVVQNVVTKQVCATVFASALVGQVGRQEVNADQVYSCSAAPGNKEVLLSVIYDGNELPIVPSELGFSDYPTANHLYLDVKTNTWGTCTDNHRSVDLSADWVLTP
jgi:hypothetical protein